ncbi:hypothetical protein VKT23_018067 [Stygiomarasmius scandens]|uniref:RING-type domain-containing protein n=1 Tax=Marasmiellus scandens TaxID=2682957 RepID=A0ABR1ISJ2_9AGAR
MASSSASSSTTSLTSIPNCVNESCYAAARLTPSEQFAIKYCSLCDVYFYSKDLLYQHFEASSRHPRCETCNRSYLNKNALRGHYELSKRHHYCASCDKLFQTPAGLRVHLDQSPKHHRRRDLPPPHEYVQINGYCKGWEDAVAEASELESMRQGEAVHWLDSNNLDGSSSSVSNSSSTTKKCGPKSRIEITKAILALKTRMADGCQPSRTLNQKCVICFCTPKTMKVTRCGHLFCESCITHAYDSSEGCPACRTLGTVSQLRTIKLTTA